MGLLDSPNVRLLDKSGTITKQGTSGWVDNSIKCEGYNTITFTVVVNSGTLDGVNSYIQLRGNIVNSGLTAVYCQKSDFDAISFSSAAVTKQDAGKYISRDISSYRFLAFYLVSSENVDVTIHYHLSYSQGIIKNTNTLLNTANETIDSLKSIVNSISGIVDRHIFSSYIFQQTLSLDTTNNWYIDLPAEIKDNYRGLRIHVIFSNTDSNCKLLVYKNNGTSVQSPREAIALITENGDYVGEIKPETNKTNYNYYTDYISGHFTLRCDKAAATTGLTCTVTAYLSSYIPPIAHIQTLATATATLTDTSQTIAMIFPSMHVLKNFKFMFVKISSSAYFSGSIVRTYSVSDDDDTTVAEFTNKKDFATEWIPINMPGERFNVKLTGSASATVTLYGVR